MFDLVSERTEGSSGSGYSPEERNWFSDGEAGAPEHPHAAQPSIMVTHSFLQITRHYGQLVYKPSQLARKLLATTDIGT